MSTEPSTTLDSFSNPNPERDYTIHIDTPEFTCLCPLTGQPDFASIEVQYVPDQLCLELKALKLYFWSYRDQGAFHEAVTNQILSDLVAAIALGPGGSNSPAFHAYQRRVQRAWGRLHQDCGGTSSRGMAGA